MTRKITETSVTTTRAMGQNASRDRKQDRDGDARAVSVAAACFVEPRSLRREAHWAPLTSR